MSKGMFSNYFQKRVTVEEQFWRSHHRLMELFVKYLTVTLQKVRLAKYL